MVLFELFQCLRGRYVFICCVKCGCKKKISSLIAGLRSWQLIRRYTGGHKGAVACLMTFMSSSGEVNIFKNLVHLFAVLVKSSSTFPFSYPSHSENFPYDWCPI